MENLRTNPWYRFWEPRIIPVPPIGSQNHVVVRSYSDCLRFKYEQIISSNHLVFGRIEPQNYLQIILAANKVVKGPWFKYMFVKALIVILLFIFSLLLLLSLLSFAILDIIILTVILLIIALALREVGRQFMIRMSKNELIMNRVLGDVSDLYLRDIGVRAVAGNYCY